MHEPETGDWLDAGLTLGVVVSAGSLLMLLVFS